MGRTPRKTLKLEQACFCTIYFPCATALGPLPELICNAILQERFNAAFYLRHDFL